MRHSYRKRNRIREFVYWGSTMNDIERAQAFRKAKKESVGFLSRVLWHLADDRDMFAESMHCALYSLYRYVDRLTGSNNPLCLYHIALSSNAAAWQRRQQNGGLENPILNENKRFTQLRKEIAQAVRQAISELPIQQSQAVVMRYIEGRPWHDIADALGTSCRHVQNHVTEAVDTIKKRVSTKRSSAA